jgi:O-antigen/teichoic acid export membrane protein
VRSTASNLASRLVMLGTWFFLTPFMVHQLGESEYGLWALIGAITAYGSLLDVGVTGAVIKYVAELRARGEFNELRVVVATCLGLLIGIGTLLALGGVILAWFVPAIFHIPVGEHATASWAVVAAGLSTGLSLPASLPAAVLAGLHRFDLAAIVSIVSMGLFAAAAVAILLLGGGVVLLVLSGIPITLVALLLSVRFVHVVAPEIRLGVRGFDRRVLRRVGRFSSGVFALQTTELLEVNTDQIVIGAFLPVASVGPYAVARRLSSLPFSLTGQFTGVLLPLASQLDAQGSSQRVKGVLVSGMRLALAGFLPIGLGLMVLARPFLTAWIGPAFGGESDIVVVLTSAAMVTTMVNPNMVISLGSNRHQVLSLLALGCGMLNLVLSLILVHVYGTLGVALGTLIAVATISAVVLPYSARIHGVSMDTIVRSALIPAGLPALPALLVLLLLRETLEPTSVLSVLLIGAAGALVYVSGYICMPACAGEREILRSGWARSGELRRRVPMLGARGA